MPVYRVPAAFSRAMVLLLLPGVPTLAERRMAGIAPEEHVRAMIRMCFGDPKRVPRERVEQAMAEMRERADQPWADRALTRSMRGLITSYLRLGNTNAWQLARTVSMPTLVLWGDKDKLVDPALAPRLAATIPGAVLEVLEGVGHVAMLEAPQPTARAVLGLIEGRDVPMSRAAPDSPRSVRS
jgi:pimeloyl-ACP methyl ester carboxylesterase